MTETKAYRICLPDIETVLPGLASIIDAEYTLGTFSETEESFEVGGKERTEWVLQGTCGVAATVVLDKYEGYLFVTVKGSGPAFQKAKEYLWKHYISQGGSPDKQEKP